MSNTLFEKIWDSHIVVGKENGPSLLYIDRHLVHEVTSPQAFEGLRMNKRKVRRPDLTIATMDHNVPTNDRSLPIIDQTSSIQIKTLEKNCQDFGINLFDIDSPYQGMGRCYFVDEVSIYVKKRGAIFFFYYNMGIPYFFKQCS